MTRRGVPPRDALSTAAVQTAIAVTGLVATFTGGVAVALTWVVRGGTARAAILLRQRQARRLLIGWAAVNWLLDALSLWVRRWTDGVTVHPGALLAAYGAASLLGLLPVTPGGLGIVEGVSSPR